MITFIASITEGATAEVIGTVHSLREFSHELIASTPRASLADGGVSSFFPVIAVAAWQSKPSFRARWQGVRRQARQRLDKAISVIQQKVRWREYVRQQFRNPLCHFFLLAFLAGLLLFTNLHQGDLSGYDDAAYAHEAKVLLQSGDWWTMRLNGYLDFDKPPLFIWLEAISFRLLGISDFAAKMPSALFGLATILLLFFLARELTADHWIPVLSMLVLMSTQYFLKYSVRAMTNVPFTFFFTLAIYCYVRSHKKPIFLLWCGVAVGLAMLTRAPMGWFPLGVVILHLLFTKQSAVLMSRYFAGCLFFSLVLPLSWYVREYLLYGNEFLTLHFGNIFNHTVSSQPKSYWQQIAWYFEYPRLLLKLYWPWLPLLLLGFAAALKKSLRERDKTACLLLIWVLTIIAPFSFADSKVLRYILPAFPAFSILAAFALQALLTPRRQPIFFKYAYLLLSLVAVTTIFFPNYRERARDMKTLAPLAEAATRPGQHILLYTSGEYQWDYRNQLLWYGERLCWHLTSLEQVGLLLACRPESVAVVDQTTFTQLAEKRPGWMEILGQSENFVCVRARTAPQQD